METTTKPSPWANNGRKSLGFWRRFEWRDSGCIEWTGGQNGNGYGRIRNAATGKNVYVHIKVYEDLVGPVPEGEEIAHLCENSICANPLHLMALDPLTHRRLDLRVSDEVCKNGHLRTPENTTERCGKRTCRQCERDKSNAYNARKRQNGK